MKNFEVVSPHFDKAVALVMGSSDEYAPYLYTSLLSIIKKASQEHNYDIVILESDMSEQNKNMIAELSDKNISIRFVDVKQILDTYRFFIRDWFHPIIYARLIIPDLMRLYKKVLYLDSDTICRVDLFELYSIEMGNKIIAGVRDTAHIALYNIPDSDIRYDLDYRLKLKRPYEYINTGVMLFNIPAFRAAYTSDFLLEYASSNEWKWQDQDVFMTLCEGKIFLLSSEWNVLVHGPIANKDDLMEKTAPNQLYSDYLLGRKEPKIIHYVANSFLLVRPLPDLFQYFWETARQSPYYEEILFRVIQKNYLRTNLQSVWDNFNRLENKVDESLINHTANKHKDTIWRRLKNKIRSVVGTIFPKNTKRGYVLRSLYHKIKG